MVEVLPFSGYRYKDLPLEKVICPPYDVISPEERQKFLNLHPYNFVHLTLGKKHPTDYQEISKILNEWINNDIFIKEDEAFYIYKQRYSWYGRKEITWGILALLKLQALGEEDILPHEQTFKGPKKDRLEVLRYCNANFEPIWGIYEDEEGFTSKIYQKLNEKDAIIKVVSWDKREHFLWKIPLNFEKDIREFFNKKKILIADGHHRYEASWLFYNEKKDERFKYIFTLLTDLYDPGIKVLPTHRVLKSSINISILDLSEFFDIYEENFDKDRINLSFNPSDPFIYYYSNGRLYKLSPNINYLSLNSEKSNIWWVLPTTLLQKGVWENVLNKKEGELQEKGLIRFSHSIDEVLEIISSDEYGSSFILPTIQLETIYTLALKNERLPQKSTYFYPKPVSGLIFWKII